MWNIVSINTASGPNTSILFGGSSGKEVIGPNGPLAGNYVLAFPGQGFITLKDKGNTVSGGDWSVQFSGAPSGSNYWFYSGGGQAKISVNASGEYTVTGGSGPDVKGKLTSWF